MNLYLCSIDIRDEAKALSFAAAVEHWMDHLQSAGMILGWRLFRRKLNLAADAYRDFLLQIEVTDFAQLDAAFRMVATRDEHVERLYHAVNTQILASDCAVYRSFPDAERCERVALI